MKRLLVVVDYQNDFISGTLGFPGADAIEGNILNLIKEFEKNSDDIVFTMDTHGKDYFSTIEGERLPIAHCQKEEKGWENPDSIVPYRNKHITFLKDKFGTVELGNYILKNKEEISEIYLCGLVADICVFANAVVALSSAKADTHIYVVRNATESNDHEMMEKSFEILKHLHIDII